MTRLRLLFLVSLAVLIVIQVIAFRPQKIEQEQSTSPVPPNELVQEIPALRLKELIPKDAIPKYQFDGFRFTSMKNKKKQWKMNAVTAWVYEVQFQIVRAQTAEALLFSKEQKEIKVWADEMYYRADGKELELYGNVKALMPDGLVIRGDYVLYKEDTQEVRVPMNEKVIGLRPLKGQERIEFESYGATSALDSGIINLLSRVLVKSFRADAKTREMVDTKLWSDQAKLNTKTQEAEFWMHSERPQRFVRIEEPRFKAVARTVDYFGLSPLNKDTRRIVAKKDVKIEETPVPLTAAEQLNPKIKPPETRFSTSGRAELYLDRNTVELSDYPQVYQGPDTITGEKIILYRDSDRVRVLESNAYTEKSQGG